MNFTKFIKTLLAVNQLKIVFCHRDRLVFWHHHLRSVLSTVFLPIPIHFSHSPVLSLFLLSSVLMMSIGRCILGKAQKGQKASSCVFSQSGVRDYKLADFGE